jgi:hypothetical protein
LTKIEQEDSLSIDLLEGNDERHKEIIRNSIVDKTEFGPVCIENRQDLTRLKRFRNSKQDLADIEALENDQKQKVLKNIQNLQDFYKRTRLLRTRLKKKSLERLKEEQIKQTNESNTENR